MNALTLDCLCWLLRYRRENALIPNGPSWQWWCGGPAFRFRCGGRKLFLALVWNAGRWPALIVGYQVAKLVKTDPIMVKLWGDPEVHYEDCSHWGRVYGGWKH